MDLKNSRTVPVQMQWLSVQQRMVVCAKTTAHNPNPTAAITHGHSDSYYVYLSRSSHAAMPL
jgi:hypothetical protein